MAVKPIDKPRADLRVPDRRATEARPSADEVVETGRVRAAVGTALSVGSALGALRTVVRLAKLGKLGPIGVGIAGVQALLALGTAVKAVNRWRDARRARRRK